MQFGVPIAYKVSNFSFGITPVLQYGSLDINYQMSPAMQDAMGRVAPGTNTNPMTVGGGIAQDLKFGYNLGIAYKMGGFTIGAIYKSQIDMEFTGSLANAVNPMVRGLSGGTRNYTNDTLSTPKEMGIGVSYNIQGHTIALDYKKIAWSDAEGYKDFEWDDQNVYALGYEYASKTWSARVGYNYAKSPISEQNYNGFNSAGLTAGTVNTFNLLGFPGMIESHYTIGGTYNFSEQFSTDLAYVYAPEATETYENFLEQDITTKHAQNSLSIQINYTF